MSHTNNLRSPISFSDLAAAQQEPEQRPAEPKRSEPTRKPASEKSGMTRKKKEAPAPTVMKGFYIDEKAFKKLKEKSYFQEVSASAVVNSALTDTLQHTYECTSPACQAVFTMRTLLEEPAAPNICPCCGKSQLARREGLVYHA